MTRKKNENSKKMQNPDEKSKKAGFDLIEASLKGFQHVVPIDSVIPYDNNPRNNDAAVEPVANSLLECGWCNAIAVESMEKRIIAAGHTRLKAAKRLGLTRVPIIPLDHLSPDRVKLYRILDNRTSEFSTWEEQLLQCEIDELTAANFDMNRLGFSEMEMNAILAEEDPVKDGRTDPDAIPDAPEEPDSQRGKIYQLGKHRLLCGDATQAADISKVMKDDLADLWITDPPYNVEYKGKTKEELTIENDKMNSGAFDKFLRQAFTNAVEAMKPGAAYYIFHADVNGLAFRQATQAAGLQIRQVLQWIKNVFTLGRQDYQWLNEPALYGWKDGAPHRFFADRKQTTVRNIEKNPLQLQPDGKYTMKAGNKIYTIEPDAVAVEEITTVVEFPKPSRNAEHPTMKPVDLLVYFIRNSTRRGEIILDNFLGSGSSLIGAERTGRVCFGLELDPHYCDVIRKRWAEFTAGEGCNWRELTPEITKE